MRKAKSKIERRLGQKLFLKGERDFSPKSAMVRRPYPPGVHGQKRRRGRLSEYGQQLMEKQKLRHTYHVSERQFARYVKESLERRNVTQKQGLEAADRIIGRLESRLDNVIFRLGFATSRSIARQMASHGHFSVNGRRVNIPSYALKKGDTISLRKKSQESKLFHYLSERLEKHQPPAWLSLDAKEFTGRVVGEPTVEEAAPPAELSMVIEHYSR